MTRLLILTLIFFSCRNAPPERVEFKETAAEKDARMDWWRDATFGLFIHWGPYAVPAGEYKGKVVTGVGEWIMHNANIPIPEYEAYVKGLNPTSFDAKEWVRIASDAGVKYIIITSKHHDGFCMWDSKFTSYDIMDAAPFKRDVLKELSEACKAAGIRFGVYHSIMDWHQPDAESKKDYPHQQSKNPNFARYRETYLKPQLAEILAKYDPDIFWFDGEWIPEWTEPDGKDLYGFLRGIKPSLIINNRVGKGRAGMQGMNKYKDAAGDFGTPEQEILESTSEHDWESCITMNKSWGFKRSDSNWKSADTLIHQLIKIAAKGGNYLLNVGPTAEGLIPQASVERLAEMGKWLRLNGEAIYATESIKQYKEGEHIRYTRSKDGKTLYAISLKKPGKTMTIRQVTPAPGAILKMPGVETPLSWKSMAGGIEVSMPEQLPGDYAWVVAISL